MVQKGDLKHPADWSEQKRDVVINEALKDSEANPENRELPKTFEKIAWGRFPEILRPI